MAGATPLEELPKPVWSPTRTIGLFTLRAYLFTFLLFSGLLFAISYVEEIYVDLFIFENRMVRHETSFWLWEGTRG